MVHTNNGVVGKGSAPLIEKQEKKNPNGLVCKRCNTILDLNNIKFVNPRKVTTKCPQCGYQNKLQRTPGIYDPKKRKK